MASSTSPVGVLLLLLLLGSAAAQQPSNSSDDGRGAAATAPPAGAPTIMPTPPAGVAPAPPPASSGDASVASNSLSPRPPTSSRGVDVQPDPAASKTAAATQQAAADAANSLTMPSVMGTQTRQQPFSNLVNLVALPGCSSPRAGSDLPPGLDATCSVSGVIGRRETDAYAFTLPAASNRTRPYRVLLELRTVDGTAQLGVSVPREGDPEGNTASLAPDVVGTQIYRTEVSSSQYVEVPWTFLQTQTVGGRYLVTVSRAQGRTVYSLKVSTPFADTTLAAPDAEAMRGLMDACCAGADASSLLCTRVLPAALAANHTAVDDLCQTPPITCDADGRITQLALAQTGLACPAGLPASLSGLGALATLDLAFNSINTTVGQTAQVLATLPRLENVFLRYTDLTGGLEGGGCELLAAAPRLTRLSLSGNRLEGGVPGCFFQHPRLQELYLSQTGLGGPLPDSLPRNSSLRLFFAIGLTQQQQRRASSNSASNAGLTGPIPPSLLTSSSLIHLDMSNNFLTSLAPGLPPNARVVNLSANAISGAFPGVLPPSLESLDLSFNSLSGRMPSDLSKAASLTLLDVSGNALTGGLPAVLPPSLLVLDASVNPRLGGALPPLPRSLNYLAAAASGLTGGLPSLPQGASLRYLLLQLNNMTGPLPLSLVNGSAPGLTFMDLSNNQLSGPLEPPAARRRLQQQQQQQGQQGQFGAGDGGNASAALLTGPWASQVALSYLDLSNNALTGPVPASLARAPSLTYLNAANNSLGGSLKPFADALAGAAPASSLLVVSFAGNDLDGQIPAGLAAAPLLDPSTRAAGRRGHPAPRVLDLSDNLFSGPFPAFLINQPPLVEAACDGCSIIVRLGGPDNRLECPAGLDVTPQQLAYLARSKFSCIRPDGSRVALLAATASLPPGANATLAGAQLDPADALAAPAAAPPGRAPPKQLAGGVIAAIVIGCLAVVFLVTALSAGAFLRWRKRRAGWRKEELDGLPPTGSRLDDVFGVQQHPLAGAGAAAASGPGGGYGSGGTANNGSSGPGHAALEMLAPPAAPAGGVGTGSGRSALV